jgi:hypothetical protein
VGQKLVCAALLLASICVFCSRGLAVDTEAEPGPKLLRLNVGETLPVAGEAGSYERTLVMPPGGETTAAGNVWEINADLAIKLARLPQAERWHVIRRNLGLSPEDRADLILWSEVDDAAFAGIAKLLFEAEPGGRDFGLRVAFPDKATSDPPADVALTFSNADFKKNAKPRINIESDLRQGVSEVLTGIEGFVEFAGGGGTPPPPEALAGIEVRLFDSGKQLVATSPVRRGYFCFSKLAVDPDFGSDYYLEAVEKDALPVSAGDLGEAKLIYVPVMRGIRTRLRLTVPAPQMPVLPEKGLQTGGWAISGGPAALLLQQFVEGSSLLGAITERLPANPGLHLGVVQTDDGPATLWSSRFVLRPPILDRRPQFVTRGKLRLQCLTVASPPSPAGLHYIKMTWLGHASQTELKLSSRHVNETPWGIGIGVAPNAEPALYAVGASYKVVPNAELLAGMGIQENRSNSFIYGLTLDADEILNGIFGKKNSGDK